MHHTTPRQLGQRQRSNKLERLRHSRLLLHRSRILLGPHKPLREQNDHLLLRGRSSHTQAALKHLALALSTFEQESPSHSACPFLYCITLAIAFSAFGNDSLRRFRSLARLTSWECDGGDAPVPFVHNSSDEFQENSSKYGTRLRRPVRPLSAPG